MKLSLVGWVIALASIYSEGVTRCPNKYKVYHLHTHTCFRFVSKKTTFTDCENVCKSKKYKRGPNRTEVGFVARLDEETDKFIKDIIADKWDSSDFWIGLSDAGKKEQYIWRDSDKTPHYFGWGDGEPNKNVDKRYTVISSAGWRKVDRNELHNCLCEVNAVFQMEMISPVAPLKIGHKAMNAFNCSFSDDWQWDKVSWYSPHEGEVVKCTPLQDGLKACQSLKTGYTGRRSGDTDNMIGIDIFNVGYQDEGKWKCDVSYQGTSLGVQEETITVKVYEPAQNISCYHQMSPTGLNVTCKTPKIYPRPDDCQWYYKYSNSNENSQNILNSISEQSTNTSGPQSDMTYAAECKLSLKKPDFEFRPGSLTISVAIDPKVEGRDTIRDYSSVYQDLTVSLELPRSPLFKNNSKGNRLDRDVTLTVGDELNLTCLVRKGKPQVETTRVECDFPLLYPSGENPLNSHMCQGMRVMFGVKAIDNMDGKTCSCWGEHLTGDTDKTELLFNIESPAQILRYSPRNSPDAGNNSTYNYALGARIDLGCKYTGKPAPTAIMRRDGSDQDLHTIQDHQVAITHSIIEASCLDSGKYTCIANNTVRGTMREEVRRSFNLSVACAPTLCDPADNNKTIGGNIGEIAKVRLCIFANPAPKMDEIQLVSKTNERPIEKKNITMRYSHTTFYQGNLELAVHVKEESFGEYEVMYEKRKVFGFHIILKGAPFCPSETRVVSVGLNDLKIEWMPGISHKAGERFVIFQLVNSTYDYQELEEIVANEIISREKVAFDLSGLKHETFYTLSVGTRNKHGSRVCERNRLNATTKVMKDSDSSDKTTIIVKVVVVPLAIILAAIILVVVLVIFWRKRKQGKAQTINVVSGHGENAPVTAASDGDGLVEYAVVNKTSKNKAPHKAKRTEGACYAEEHVYNNTPLAQSGAACASTPSKSGPAGKGPSNEEKKKGDKAKRTEGACYAEEYVYNTPLAQSRAARASTPSKSGPAGKGPSNAEKKKGDKAKRTEGACYAEEYVYNTPLAQSRAARASTPSKSGPAGKGPSNAEKKKGGGLTYVSVSFDSNNKITLKGEEGSKPPKKREPATEYTTVDFVATNSKSGKTETLIDGKSLQPTAKTGAALGNASTPSKSCPAGKGPSNAEKKKGDELTYVSLSFDSNNKMKLKGEDGSNPPKKKESATEYTTVDFVATNLKSGKTGTQLDGNSLQPIVKTKAALTNSSTPSKSGLASKGPSNVEKKKGGELTYVSVSFDSNNKVILKGEDGANPPKKREPATEYSTVDFVATNVKQKELAGNVAIK